MQRAKVHCYKIGRSYGTGLAEGRRPGSFCKDGFISL